MKKMFLIIMFVMTLLTTGCGNKYTISDCTKVDGYITIHGREIFLETWYDPEGNVYMTRKTL